MTQDASPDTWGFAHPDCRGAAALLFFMNDLARVANQYLRPGHLGEEALADAQKAVDALLQHYVEIEAAPEAFDGERIELALETDTRTDNPKNAEPVANHLLHAIVLPVCLARRHDDGAGHSQHSPRPCRRVRPGRKTHNAALIRCHAPAMAP